MYIKNNTTEVLAIIRDWYVVVLPYQKLRYADDWCEERFGINELIFDSAPQWEPETGFRFYDQTEVSFNIDGFWDFAFVWKGRAFLFRRLEDAIEFKIACG